MDSNREYDHLFKILLIGNLNVGKTSLILRFADPDRSEDYHPVIGMDLKLRTLKLNDEVIRCQIWDTAGQERFKTITSSYYRGANGIFLVYDVNDRQSFTDLDNWLVDIRKNINEGVPMLLIGNKSDSEKERQVSEEEGKVYAERLGIRFVETSAKHTKNVDVAFEDLVNQLLVSPQMSSHETVGTRLSRNDADVARENSRRCC